MMLPPEAPEGKWGARRARLVAGALALVFVVIVGRATQVALMHEAGAAAARPEFQI
jgi:hypothetical protein